MEWVRSIVHVILFLISDDVLTREGRAFAEDNRALGWSVYHEHVWQGLSAITFKGKFGPSESQLKGALLKAKSTSIVAGALRNRSPTPLPVPVSVLSHRHSHIDFQQSTAVLQKINTAEGTFLFS